MKIIIRHITLLSALVSLMVLSGCKKQEYPLSFEPVKVEMPQDPSALFEELGFEYSTIAEAESEIVAELDSISSSGEDVCSAWESFAKLGALVENDPRTFSYDFPLMQDRNYLSVKTSDDGKLRLFDWLCGTPFGQPEYGNVIQFESDGEIYAYPCGIYELSKTEAEGTYPDYTVKRLYTVPADNGDTFYLADVYIPESAVYVYQVICPVMVSGGRLVPADIFEQDPEDEESNCTGREYSIADWYQKTDLGDDRDCFFRYDADTKTLYVPEVDDMELTDRYNLYRFNGRRFEYAGEAER